MMPRTIKFRTWCSHSGWFKYDFMLSSMTVSDGTGDGWDSGQILEQWTGLKDKNGKEIYEGDIVKSRYGIHEVQIFEEHTPERGGFDDQWEHKASGWQIYWPCEVIGNVHENPELLEDKKDVKGD